MLEGEVVETALQKMEVMIFCTGEDYRLYLHVYTFMCCIKMNSWLYIKYPVSCPGHALEKNKELKAWPGLETRIRYIYFRGNKYIFGFQGLISNLEILV